MKVKVLFFGLTKDIVGKSSLTFEIETNTSVLEFHKVLQDKFNGFSQINSFAFAVNETYVDNNYIIKLGDVIALIPPVSGG